MWKEVKIDDDIFLQKHADLVRDVFCGPIEAFDEVLTKTYTKRILTQKQNVYCYFYEDDIIEVSTMYKYDAEIDRIIYFQYFFRFKKTNDADYLARVASKGLKIILEKHSKICRCQKFGDIIFIDRFGITEAEFTKKAIRIYPEHGVKVIDYEEYWEYELI